MNKIMIIDDEEDFREIAKKILSKKFEVIASENADDGWKILQENTPDLLLLDINLPKVGGYTLCQRIRNDEKLKKLPVIMLTIRHRKEDQLKGLNVGADDYILKPFEPKELVARIERVLERCRAERE
ncbi:MAG: response regulator [Elusimicrobia bacterium]|nr:response regulator [Elusimicrobiota bacterium]